MSAIQNEKKHPFAYNRYTHRMTFSIWDNEKVIVQVLRAIEHFC